MRVARYFVAGETGRRRYKLLNVWKGHPVSSSEAKVPDKNSSASHNDDEALRLKSNGSNRQKPDSTKKAKSIAMPVTVPSIIEIRPADFPKDLPTVLDLFREYAAGRAVDLSFQGFEEELSALPGKYAPPSGRLLLAWRGADALGSVALRRIDRKSSEMKRLYVRPAARGEQLGRRLAERICAEARDAGYSRICLDTLPTMASAQALYASLGFEPIEAYVFNPIPGTKYLALSL
jgi:GNAT superfamily N-acetyltransferase